MTTKCLDSIPKCVTEVGGIEANAIGVNDGAADVWTPRRVTRSEGSSTERLSGKSEPFHPR
jgi:hypothetical protein